MKAGEKAKKNLKASISLTDMTMMPAMPKPMRVSLDYLNEVRSDDIHDSDEYFPALVTVSRLFLSHWNDNIMFDWWLLYYIWLMMTII